jgi:hypothetical protein
MRTILLSIAILASARPAPSSLIDRHLEARWSDAGIAPARPAGDAEFLRRASIDILGTLPSADEASAFLADPDPRKRDLKVLEMLGRPEYAHNWAELWEDILIGYDAAARQLSKASLYGWLRDAVFRHNMPYNEMAGALIAARGVDVEQGQTGFLLRHVQKGGGPAAAASKVSRVFLGIQIACAQCHDHPFDRYTQEDFYGMVSFFSRTQSKKVSSQDAKDNRLELYESPRGADASYGEGKDKKTVPACFLDGTKPQAGRDRRDEFARLLTRVENPQFAKAVVNRYWGHFFGRGIVHPIDDFSGRIKPSHPELLDELAREFAAQGFDLQWLIRTITSSRAYRLTSRVGKDRPPALLFASAQVRALRPEQIYNVFTRGVLGETPMPGAAPAPGGKNRGNERDNLLAQFRKLFGDEENVDIAEFDGTIPQALLFMNGPLLSQGIASKTGLLSRILEKETEPARRLERLFLSTVSRPPGEREKAALLAHLEARGNRREAYEDVAWTVLNSSEFLFNH